MTASIEMCIETAPFERIEADLAVAGFFLDERPLRGAAGRADWRLCGVVSDLMGCGRLRGKVGEATLVPSMGRMGADRVLLLGLGRKSSFRVGRARDTVHAAVQRGLAMGAERIVIAPPVGGPEAFSRHASGFVRGAVEAADPTGRNLRLSVAMPGSQAKEGLKSLEKAVAADRSERIQWMGLVSRKSAPGGLSGAASIPGTA
jgi:leucyl aminopeptidase